jgi:hypothetical protein
MTPSATPANYTTLTDVTRRHRVNPTFARVIWAYGCLERKSSHFRSHKLNVNHVGMPMLCDQICSAEQ